MNISGKVRHGLDRIEKQSKISGEEKEIMRMDERNTVEWEMRERRVVCFIRQNIKMKQRRGGKFTSDGW